ncbi:mitochondrial 54S ribosomal protein YmL35 [Paramarasmius palmivorus]|uniref:Mitochondrial 54S ribosomal protein YmL35 n=1 Tax=Paramarasmius palmivorus TaxID=297713 RepID=A0AAW0CP37_9AGAR
MLALRRGPISSRIFSVGARRFNASLQSSASSIEASSSGPRTKETLLTPTLLKPQHRRPSTLPKPLKVDAVKKTSGRKASAVKERAKEAARVKANARANVEGTLGANDGLNSEATTTATSGDSETPTRGRTGRTKTGRPTQTKADGGVTPDRGLQKDGNGRTKGKRRVITRSRPRISLTKTRKWNRPLREGVLPAYDEALKVIYKDSRLLKKEAAAYSLQIKSKAKELAAALEAAKNGSEKDKEEAVRLDAELEKMREKLGILEVQSEVNLPHVRWAVANAMADMTKRSHRHLAEQRWRSDGKLDLLMERIHQMNICPDVLPVIHPTVDLDVNVKPALSEVPLTGAARRFFLVEPGSFVTSLQTLKPPTLFPHVFHTDTRLYTMLMVDPDVPDETNQTFTTYLHWLKPNIPLSATHRGPITHLNTHTRYIPPHPQRGTPYHRYTVLLLPNPPKTSYSLNTEATATRGVPTSKSLDIPVVPDDQRLGFNVRDFVKKWGLNAAMGGGYHMFREVWDEHVTHIYEAVLGRSEPRYGLPPKENRHEVFKTLKKYP